MIIDFISFFGGGGGGGGIIIVLLLAKKMISMNNFSQVSDKCCSSELSIHQRNLNKLYSTLSTTTTIKK